MTESYTSYSAHPGTHVFTAGTHSHPRAPHRLSQLSGGFQTVAQLQPLHIPALGTHAVSPRSQDTHCVPLPSKASRCRRHSKDQGTASRDTSRLGRLGYRVPPCAQGVTSSAHCHHHHQGCGTGDTILSFFTEQGWRDTAGAARTR